MIKYKIDILAALKEKGYTSYKLKKEKIFCDDTIVKFRRKKYFNSDILNTLCELLECQPADIIEYIKS